ncbi:hypothetical protein PHMEG_00038679 [Phytophthora megakarya]|uniref:Uncharacterized protein n=1 Tax=Phytophthora megakarya TaxID=4795 RepID=A0A225UGL8_9STRA|nr:hypothetical protein PHMEG_00038679 [Phytophthora megakarya]
MLQFDCSTKVIHQATTENELTDTRLLRSNSAFSTRNTEERTVGSVFEKLTSVFNVNTAIWGTVTSYCSRLENGAGRSPTGAAGLTRDNAPFVILVARDFDANSLILV